MKWCVFHPERADLALVGAISRNLPRPVHLTPSSPGMMDALVPRQDECVEEKILHSKMRNKRPVIPAGRCRHVHFHTRLLVKPSVCMGAEVVSHTVFGGQQGRTFDCACPLAAAPDFLLQRLSDVSVMEVTCFSNGLFPVSCGLFGAPVSLGALGKEDINVAVGSD